MFEISNLPKLFVELPFYLGNSHLEIRPRTYFQQDGATAHNARIVSELLNSTFTGKVNRHK